MVVNQNTGHAGIEPPNAPSRPPDEVVGADVDGGGKHLRVAWITGQRCLNLFSRVLGPLAVGLMDELVELELLCPESTVEIDLAGPPVEIVRFPRYLFGRRARTVRRLAEKVRADSVDLIHTLDPSLAELSAKVARAVDLPLVISSIGIADTKLAAGCGESAAAILAYSEPLRQALISGDVADQEKIQVIHPGVYSTRRPTVFSRDDRGAVIVAGGPMDHFGPFGAILEAFKELHERRFDCMFVIVGSGRADRRIRRQANHLGLRGDLTFVDWPDPMQFTGIIKAADVYISAAATPVIDVHSLLAMSTGSAVLAAHDPPSDFIIDGQTALTFEQGNAAELTTKLVSLLDDPGAARSLGQSALTYVQKHHSSAAFVASVTAVYRGVAEDSR